MCCSHSLPLTTVLLLLGRSGCYHQSLLRTASGWRVHYTLKKSESSSACVVNTSEALTRQKWKQGRRPLPAAAQFSLRFLPASPLPPPWLEVLKAWEAPLSVCLPPPKSLWPALCVWLLSLRAIFRIDLFSSQSHEADTLGLGWSKASLLCCVAILGHFSHSNLRAFSMGLSFSEFLLRCGEGGSGS